MLVIAPRLSTVRVADKITVLVLGLVASLLVLGPPSLPDGSLDRDVEQLAVGLRFDGPPECEGWNPCMRA